MKRKKRKLMMKKKMKKSQKNKKSKDDKNEIFSFPILTQIGHKIKEENLNTEKNDDDTENSNKEEDIEDQIDKNKELENAFFNSKFKQIGDRNNFKLNKRRLELTNPYGINFIKQKQTKLHTIHIEK
jgi:hypothetical protein